MKKQILLHLLIVMGVFLLTQCIYASEAGSEISPDQAIKMLKKGNQNYIKNHPTYPNRDQTRRDLTSSKGQHPFATVVACSDSRVPVEILLGVSEISL